MQFARKQKIMLCGSICQNESVAAALICICSAVVNVGIIDMGLQKLEFSDTRAKKNGLKES